MAKSPLLNNILQTYDEYLRKEADKNAIERYIGKEGWFNASWAGHCFRKHVYKMLRQEPLPQDTKSLITMRLGSVLHDDIQSAMLKHWIGQDAIVICESEVELPEFNVRGYYDIALVYKNKIHLIDIKTIGSFGWKRKFGLKKNREPNPSEKYELQIATYALGCEAKYSKPVVNMSLLYYNKDKSDMKEINILNSYKTKAKAYWESVLTYCKPEPKLDDLEPGETYGCPFESWECNYCLFKHVCHSPLIKR